MRKRSSCDSGSGKVPTCSVGFCVAMTKKGSGSRRVSPSAVTWCSSMASSSADCVFGVARLTSSARITCAKIGPGWNLKLPLLALVDGDAEDVGRQHVARELDALELQSERARQHVRERGLADAGNVLDQQVAAREQAGERHADLPFLAENDAADLVDHT